MIKISNFKIHNFKGKFFITFGDICDDERIAKVLNLEFSEYIQLAITANSDIQYDEFCFFNNENDAKRFISLLEKN